MTYEEFIKTLSENEEQANQFASMMEEASQLSDEEKAAKASHIAGELGFEVPVSEFALLIINATQELDDDELAKVAGGNHCQGEYCTAAYACVFTFQNCFISNECSAGSRNCMAYAGPCRDLHDL